MSNLPLHANEEGRGDLSILAETSGIRPVEALARPSREATNGNGRSARSSGIVPALGRREAPSAASAAAAQAILTRDQFLSLAEAEQNPHATAIEREAAEIARTLGLLRRDNGPRFDAFNSLVRYVYPRASVARGVACATWCNWLFFFDDIHDEDPRTSLDLQRCQQHMEHHLRILRGEAALSNPGPLELLTLEFRERAEELAGEPWVHRFAQVVHEYLLYGVLPAVTNWRFRRTPSLADYIEQRVHDSAVMTAIDLIELACGLSIPDEVRSSRLMVEARRACVKTIAFFNDIVSYPKEVLRHKNPNNLVHVLMNERGISLRTALHQATELTNEAAYDLMRTELRIVAKLPAGPHPIKDYLRAMRIWQRGNIDSSLEGERYASRWSPFAELFRGDSRR